MVAVTIIFRKELYLAETLAIDQWNIEVLSKINNKSQNCAF